MKKYREGSMGAAQQKTDRMQLIIFSLIFFAGYLCWIIPSNLYPSGWFREAAIGWKVMAFISIIAHYWFMWFKVRQWNDSGKVGTKMLAFLFIFGFALNLCFLSGWNFDIK